MGISKRCLVPRKLEWAFYAEGNVLSRFDTVPELDGPNCYNVGLYQYRACVDAP